MSSPTPASPFRKPSRPFLPEPDFRVFFFEDGAELVEALPDLRPDTILLGLSLRGLDAYEVGRWIGGREDLRIVPLFFLKGTFESFDPDKAEGVSCDGIFQKPFDSELLGTAIRGAIDKKLSPPTMPEELLFEDIPPCRSRPGTHSGNRKRARRTRRDWRRRSPESRPPGNPGYGAGDREEGPGPRPDGHQGVGCRVRDDKKNPSPEGSFSSDSTNTKMKIGDKIHRFETCASSNDEARRLAIDGEGEGTVIVARSQTAGRGTRGRTWFSPPGSGLYMTVILRPFILSLDSSPLGRRTRRA